MNNVTSINSCSGSIGSLYGAGASSGSLNGSAGGLIGQYSGYYPYTPVTTTNWITLPVSNPVKYDIQLRKVENGWILYKDNKEYVITKPEQILKYLQEDK